MGQGRYSKVYYVVKLGSVAQGRRKGRIVVCGDLRLTDALLSKSLKAEALTAVSQLIFLCRCGEIARNFFRWRKIHTNDRVPGVLLQQ